MGDLFQLVMDSVKVMADHPYISIPASLTLLGATMYGINKSVRKREDQENEELTAVMDSMPKEHHDSVGRVLTVLRRYHPADSTTQRTESLQKEYGLKA